jgi:hypothetical protein
MFAILRYQVGAHNSKINNNVGSGWNQNAASIKEYKMEYGVPVQVDR